MSTNYEAPAAYRAPITESEQQRADLVRAAAARDETAARGYVAAAIANRQAEADALAAVTEQLDAARSRAVAAYQQTPEGRAELQRRSQETLEARRLSAAADDAVERATMQFVAHTAEGPRQARVVDPRGTAESIRLKCAALAVQTADSQGRRA